MSRCEGFAFDTQITDGLTGVAWVRALEYLEAMNVAHPNEDQIAEAAMEAVIEARQALPNMVKREAVDMASDVFDALCGLRDAHLMMLEPEGHA